MKHPEFDPQTQLINTQEQEVLNTTLQHLLQAHGQPSDEYGFGAILLFKNTLTEHSKLADEYYESEQEVRIWTVEKSTGSYAKGNYIEIWTNLTPEEPDLGPGNGLHAWHLQSVGLLSDGSFYEADEFQILDDEGRLFDTWLVPTHGKNKSKATRDYEKQRVGESHQFQTMLDCTFTQADFEYVLGILGSFDPVNVL